jgi:hypothetical protein
MRYVFFVMLAKIDFLDSKDITSSEMQAISNGNRSICPGDLKMSHVGGGAGNTTSNGNGDG